MKDADAVLVKEDTVSLWHAVEWMETVLKGWIREGFEKDEERARYEVELGRLIGAKRALRKANAIRRAQSRRPRNTGSSLLETA